LAAATVIVDLQICIKIWDTMKYLSSGAPTLKYVRKGFVELFEKKLLFKICLDLLRRSGIKSPQTIPQHGGVTFLIR
jgi:hypothetical protein